MYSIPTVKLKLTVLESSVIGHICEDAFDLIDRQTDRKNIRNDTVMIAEFLPSIQRKIISHRMANVWEKSYSLPLSIARSIHYRLQTMKVDYNMQSVLTKLDLQLTNLGYKPVTQLSLL